MVGLGAAKLLVSGLYELPDRSYSSIILLDHAHIFSHRMAKFFFGQNTCKLFVIGS